MSERRTAELAERGNGRVEEASVEQDERSVVQMALPASPRFLRLARLTGASLGADLGMSLDDIEDLRVAVDELCAAAIEDAPLGSRLDLEFHATDSHLVVEGSVVVGTASSFVLHPVAAALLDIVAGEFSIGDADGVRTFRLLTRRPGDDAGH